MKNHRIIPLIAIVSVVLAARGAAATPVADLDRFNRQVRPLLERHCVECHGAEKEKGKLRVDTLNPDLFTGADGERWQDVLDQINSGDMPPKDAKQKITRAQREVITGWLQSEMKLAGEVRSGVDGRAAIRRLTKYEFNYSLQDLLKVDLDFAKNLPEDRAGADGLRNNASLLGMTAAQFEVVTESAETALRKAMVAPEKPRIFKYHVEPEKGDHRVKKKTSPGQTVGGGVRLFPGRDYVMSFEDRPLEGRFQIRVRAGALPDAHGVAPVLQVWLGYQATGTAFAKEMLAEKAVTAPLERPEVIVFEGSIENFPIAFTEKGENARKKNKIKQGLMVWLVAAGDAALPPPPDKGKKAKKGKGNAPAPSSTAAASGQQILLDWFEFEGPCFESWPPASRVACVGKDTKGAPADRARAALLSFAARAWRRPVLPAETESLVAAFSREFAKGHDFDVAMRHALSLIIASPDFLYLVEPAGDQPRALNTYELAARLSYFLWCSGPDNALWQAAYGGKLSDKAVLAEQVRRMLADPKAHRLATQFTGQWLGVDQMDAVAVNPEYYPTFHHLTQESLKRESGEFFWHVLSQKRSALEFLDSDYVVVDDVLARHYGLKGVSGSDFRPVKITPENHRGGVLGMGGFMLAQSDGAQSNPIFRGKWLLANLLNTPPPPPPPNVPQLDQADANFAKLPLKAQLEFHRKVDACASCHDKLDPYGLALENFDAVGQWRQREWRIVSHNAGAPKSESVSLDASAKFPDGTPVNGFAELKAYLLRTKRDAFAEGLVRKLLAFALGRSLAWTDQAEVARLKTSFASSGYKLDALITEVVLSAPFRTK